jgi:ATP-binding cassette subfamily B protein
VHPNISESIFDTLFQVWQLLSRARKIQYLILILLIITSSVFEIITIGSLIPFIKGVNDPEAFYFTYINNNFFRIYIENNPTSIIITIGIIFAILAVTAAFFKILVIYGTSKIAFKSGGDITNTIYENTISQPFFRYNQLKSNEVINIISGKVSSLINSVIIPCLYLINSLIMSCVIVAGLLYIDYKVALSIFTIYAILYLTILLFTKKILSENSKIISISTSEIIKLTQTALGGIRNIIIDRNREIFINKFRMINNDLRVAQASSVFIGNSPKNILEAFALVLISVIAISKTNSNEDPAEIVATIGVIALAAQRLLPLMQQAFSAWTGFRENKFSVIDILSFIQSAEVVNEIEEDINFNNSIELKNICYRYKSRNNIVLENFSLEIKKGEKIALIGKTGAGKSTIVDLILGLILHDSGQILIDGIEHQIYDNKTWHDIISHVPQNIYVFDGSIAENIAFGIPRDKIDIPKLINTCKLAQVSEFTDQLSEGIFTNVGESGSHLSGGQRQRIGIARALYKKAQILIFDEAMSSLDQVTETKILDAINKNFPDTTVISVTHNPNTLSQYSRTCTIGV